MWYDFVLSIVQSAAFAWLVGLLESLVGDFLNQAVVG